MTYEVIIENCIDIKKVRLIVFEMNKNNVRSVRDIYEGDVCDSVARFFGDVVDLLESDGTVTVLNENIDFGRAKRWEAKMKKLMNTLVEEGRYN